MTARSLPTRAFPQSQWSEQGEYQAPGAVGRGVGAPYLNTAMYRPNSLHSNSRDSNTTARSSPTRATYTPQHARNMRTHAHRRRSHPHPHSTRQVGCAVESPSVEHSHATACHAFVITSTGRRTTCPFISGSIGAVPSLRSSRSSTLLLRLYGSVAAIAIKQTPSN